MAIPAEVLGVGNDVLDPTRKLRMFRDLQDRKVSKNDAWSTAASLCTVTDGISLVYYLLGERPESRRWARKTVHAVEYYLFGDWRQAAKTDEGRIDPDWWFSGPERSVGWTTELCYGLCWAAACSLWDDVGTLLQFPNEDVKADLGGVLPRAFYLGLAKWWRDHGELEWIDEVKGMRGAGSKDFHLRCDVLRAISAGDATLVTKSFKTYLEYWIKRVKDCPQRLAKDAALLWHVARREGFAIDLADNLLVHMPILPDED